MARNKYIYCLADSSLVIHSGRKGGTLNGAEENLKKGWVPLWVKPTSDKNAANADLVIKGGRWCEADIQNLKVSELFSVGDTIASQVTEEQPDFFSTPTHSVSRLELESSPGETEAASEKSSGNDEPLIQPVDFYQLFIAELQRLAVAPVSMDALVESTGLHKSQLNEWLKRAIHEGSINKLTRPVRYQLENKK